MQGPHGRRGQADTLGSESCVGGSDAPRGCGGGTWAELGRSMQTLLGTLVFI